jgi:hypothetical protein
VSGKKEQVALFKKAPARLSRASIEVARRRVAPPTRKAPRSCVSRERPACLQTATLSPRESFRCHICVLLPLAP